MDPALLILDFSIGEQLLGLRFQPSKHAIEVREVPGADIGELESSCHAYEQVCAQKFFEVSDLVTDR